MLTCAVLCSSDSSLHDCLLPGFHWIRSGKPPCWPVRSWSYCCVKCHRPIITFPGLSMVKDNHFNFHRAGCLSISSSFPSELKGGQVFLGAFASFSQSYSYFSVIPQLYISRRTAKLINTPNNWNPNLIGVEVVFSFLAFFCKKVKDCYLYISERGPPHTPKSWLLSSLAVMNPLAPGPMSPLPAQQTSLSPLWLLWFCLCWVLPFPSPLSSLSVCLLLGM